MDFLRTAGSLILAISIVVWAAAYYPHNSRVVQEETQQKAKLQDEMEWTPDGSPQRAEIEEKLTGLDNQIAAKYQQHSVLGAMGKTIEPVVRPLGWDWRIGCAVIASFPAREVVVATLGVVYGMGEEDRREIGGRPQGIGNSHATGRLGRHRPAGIHVARGLVADGIFRLVRARNARPRWP